MNQYSNLLDILNELRIQTLNIPGAITRVIELFPAHPEMIDGLNTFLPPGYRIEVTRVNSEIFTIFVHTPQVYTT